MRVILRELVEIGTKEPRVIPSEAKNLKRNFWG